MSRLQELKDLVQSFEKDFVKFFENDEREALEIIFFIFFALDNIEIPITMPVFLHIKKVRSLSRHRFFSIDFTA